MKPIKTVLVPTDFSKESEEAGRYAMKFARTLEAKVHVLHVVELGHLMIYGREAFWPSETMIDEIQKAAQNEMTAYLRKITDGDKIESQVVTYGGAVADHICEEAEKCDAGLIVMATHGRAGLDRLLLGSVMERVLRVAPCPVTVVPPAMLKAS